MDFALPPELTTSQAGLQMFIEAEIRPLDQAEDSIRLFDHRREWTRTNSRNGDLVLAGGMLAAAPMRLHLIKDALNLNVDTPSLRRRWRSRTASRS